MKGAPNAMATWWRGRSPRARLAMLVIVAVGGTGLLAGAWTWQRMERARLAGQMAAMDARVKRTQEGVTAVQALRTRPVPATMEGQVLADTVAASLNSRGLNLAVTPLDAGRLRLSGAAGFDETIAWLGSMQKDHRLSVISLTAGKQGGGAQFDALLGVVVKP